MLPVLFTSKENVSERNIRPVQLVVFIYMHRYNLLNNTWLVQRPQTSRESQLRGPFFNTPHLPKENTNE